MTSNLYSSLINHQQYSRFQVDELLYVEYKCLEPGNELVYNQLPNAYWSPRNYFVYVLQGKKKWSTQNHGYLLQAGELIFIKNGTFASHKFYEEEQFWALIISMPNSFICQTMREHPLWDQDKIPDLPSDTIIPVEIDASLKTYFESVYSYFSKTKLPPDELLKIKFKELIISILSDHRNRALISYFQRINQENGVSIPEVMESNFIYELSLEDYAKMCGRSLSSFKREFQVLYGKSPGKWLIQKRLQFARWLLENTQKDINEVAYESGFKNPSHFSRIFKETHGKPPRQFRVFSQFVAP